jgi:hypothetical protein
MDTVTIVGFVAFAVAVVALLVIFAAPDSESDPDDDWF